MNIENQMIEFKEIWKDDFLKTLAAFANTDGGTLIIGRDDHGNIKGLDNAREILEYLPNKIIQKLNIHPLVKYIEINGKSTIEIKVDAYETAVSFNGKYFIRSGSTTQELSDRELQRFLLTKCNWTWESVPIANASITDLNLNTLAKFKELAKKRIPNIENENSMSILKKLHLIDENEKLKRAAILLFGNDPQKYFHSSFFKIGKFKTDTVLVTDDIIEGNLFEQYEQILSVLRTKYISLIITGYKDWQRLEALEYPADALREAVINALVHKDYVGSHTQMKIYDDKIVLWNPGELLKGICIEDLKKSHESVLRNELICNAFYKAGLIEAWGRGTTLMVEKFVEAGLPEPEYRQTQGGIELIFFKDKFHSKYLNESALNSRQLNAIQFIKQNGRINNEQYRQLNNIKKASSTRDLTDLVEKNILTKEGTRGKGTSYILNGS